MSKRFGAVLVFKRETTRPQAIEAIKRLKHVLDLDRMDLPFVQEFDERDGGPVWYVP